MAQKFIHTVDTELSGDAQYKTFDAIPAYAKTAGTTVRFLPGVYEMGTANVDNLTFEGVGDPVHVVLANFILGSGSANTVTFRNLTFSGNSGVAASTGWSHFIHNGVGSVTANYRHCRFVNGDFGIDSQSASAIVNADYCDFSAVDRALRSNLVALNNCTISFSKLNASANAYFTGANAVIKSVTVIASCSAGGGSNTGNTLETVKALVS